MTKRDAREPNILKTALIQLYFNPNVMPNSNYEIEPAYWGFRESREKNYTISHFDHISDQTTKSVINNYNLILQEEYINWFEKKLEILLKYLEVRNIDVAVFPEYSLPNTDNIKQLLMKYSKGKIIFAGSEVIKGDDGRKIAVTLAYNNGKRIFQEKIIISPLEEGLVEQGDPKSWNIQNYNDSKIAFYLCSDFLGTLERKTSIIEAEQNALKKEQIEFADLDLILISSLSPNEFVS